MVAPNKNQTVELSPSFSKKDVVEQRTKENVALPLLVMELEPATTERQSMRIHEHLNIPSSSSSPTTTTSATNTKKNKKSVTFSENVRVKKIPMLTEEEKIGMFTTKQDKQESKLLVKLLVKYYRANRSNSFYFAPATASASEESQIPPEERTKIGLEPHLNPKMKLTIRRRMWKVVLQHQDWSREHFTSLDDQILAQNCTTVAKSATLLAVERAQNVVQELANDRKQEGSRRNFRVKMPSSFMKASFPYSATVFATTVTRAIETVAVDTANATSKESRMEAPGQILMVR